MAGKSGWEGGTVDCGSVSRGDDEFQMNQGGSFATVTINENPLMIDFDSDSIGVGRRSTLSWVNWSGCWASRPVQRSSPSPIRPTTSSWSRHCYVSLRAAIPWSQFRTPRAFCL